MIGTSLEVHREKTAFDLLPYKCALAPSHVHMPLTLCAWCDISVGSQFDANSVIHLWRAVRAATDSADCLPSLCCRSVENRAAQRTL